MSELPPGFVLDQPNAPTNTPALPPGFALDAPPSRMGEVATDVAKAVPSGFAKGVAGLAGLPGAAQQGYNWLYRNTLGRVESGIRSDGQDWSAPSSEEQIRRWGGFGQGLKTGDQIQAGIEKVTGPLYQPQTVPGQYAGTIAEFIPGMALPGGTLAQRAAMAVVPALASETAGQVTKGTAAEPYARLGGALVGGFGVAGAQLAARRPPEELLRNAAGGQLTPEIVNAAERRIIDAANQGITVTWDEALNHVTNGAVNLGGIRAGAVSRPEGATRFNEVMAQRPGQIEAAARQQFDNLAPPAADPFAVGRQAVDAAEGVVDGTRQAINRSTEPLYNAAATQRVDPATFAQIQAAPGWAEASAAVRNNPQLARYVQGMPDDSVGFLQQVQRYLNTAAENARGPMNVQRNQQVAAGYTQDAALVRRSAEAASPEYAQAQATQAAMRERYLQPLLDGPIGKIAAKDPATENAVAALFPANPLPNSQAQVETAVRALNAQRPRVADQIIRTHAEMTFNEAAQNLQGGLNAYGGANFAAKIAGNSQQAQNLEAAITAARGPEVWQGFRNFLDILETTGKAARGGSNTADKLAAQDAMKSGRLVGEIGNAIATGGVKVPGRLKGWYEQVQMGRNSAQLADILIDPQSVALFRRLADGNLSVPASLGLATRLTYMGERSVSREPTKTGNN